MDNLNEIMEQREILKKKLKEDILNSGKIEDNKNLTEVTK